MRMFHLRCMDVCHVVCAVHPSIARVPGHQQRGCSPSARCASTQLHAHSSEGEETVADFLERRKREMNPYTQTSRKGAKQTVRTLLGVDYSPSKTGVAVSTDGFAPQPLMVFKSPPQFVDGAKRLIDIAQQHGCDGIVLGVPLTPNQQLWNSQQDSRIGRRCRNFAHTVAMLAKAADLHVFIVSERYSTAEATDLLENNKRNKKKIQDRIDAAAAAIVLERFFQDREGSVLMKPKYGLVPGGNKPS